MKEYGSDFHKIDGFKTSDTYPLFNKGQLYGIGRHAINSLLLFGQEKSGWKRLWLPEFFCYTVIDSIKSTGIELKFYCDNPEGDDEALIGKINFEKGDVLFRMNYFGLRSFRDNSNISVPVIEDHSHNLISDWAHHSNADYCIASIRKTIPTTAGGILWSPKNKVLPSLPEWLSDIEFMSSERLLAMFMKREYLKGKFTDKNFFRSIYLNTEGKIDNLPVSSISFFDKDFVNHFDISEFTKRKKDNYNILAERLSQNINIKYLNPENESSIPFSFLLKFNSLNSLTEIKTKLIRQAVYPAHLWPLPEYIQKNYNSFLSIHCDGRYGKEDVKDLSDILIKIL